MPNPTLDVMTLVHEVGHVFGAEHVNDRQSIMHEDFGLPNRIRRQKPRRHPKKPLLPICQMTMQAVGNRQQAIVGISHRPILLTCCLVPVA